MAVSRLGSEIGKRGLDDDARAFWGLEENGGADALEARYTDPLVFFRKLSLLDRAELGLLVSLRKKKGTVNRGGLDAGSEILERLTRYFFIHIKKDRALLTNRFDRIYLFPETAEMLDRFQIIDSADCIKRFDPPGDLTVKERSEPLAELILNGGIMRPDPEDHAMDGFVREGLVHPGLYHDSEGFICVWIFDGVNHNLPQTKNEDIRFIQTPFLGLLRNSIEALRFRKPVRRNVETVVKEALGDAVRPKGTDEVFIREMYEMGIFEDGTEPDLSWARLNYDETVSRMKKALYPLENTIMSIVKERSVCSRDYIVSRVMRERFIQDPVTKNGTDGLHEVKPQIIHGVERLIFRGFLLSDMTGNMVKLNDLRKGDVPGSLIVNNDGEVIVYAEAVSSRTLWLLTCFTRVLGIDGVIRLKIDRDSVLRGVELCRDAGSLIGVLERNSRSPVRRIVALIREWTDGFTDAGLRQGPVIVVHSDTEKLRILHNNYIGQFVDEESGKLLLLSKDIDTFKLRKELRKEGFLLDSGTIS